MASTFPESSKFCRWLDGKVDKELYSHIDKNSWEKFEDMFLVKIAGLAALMSADIARNLCSLLYLLKDMEYTLTIIASSLLGLVLICIVSVRDGEAANCSAQTIPWPKDTIPAGNSSSASSGYYRPFEKVYFKCKSGYQPILPNNGQSNSVLSLMCDSNGKWQFQDQSGSVTCQKFDCPQTHFKCISDNKCIPKQAKCDCIRNCPDNSDEQGCKLPTRKISAEQKMKKMQSFGFPTGYNQTRCLFKIEASTGKVIHLKFLDFDLKNCEDRVILDNYKYDKYVCKKYPGRPKNRCSVWCDKEPAASTSKTNWMSIEVDFKNNVKEYRGFHVEWTVENKVSPAGWWVMLVVLPAVGISCIPFMLFFKRWLNKMKNPVN